VVFLYVKYSVDILSSIWQQITHSLHLTCFNLLQI